MSGATLCPVYWLASVDDSGRQIFIGALGSCFGGGGIIRCALEVVWIVASAGGGPGSHSDRSFGYGFRIDDNLGWARLFVFHALEVGRGDLERIEGESGIFAIDSPLQKQLCHLAKHDLNGMRILEQRHDDLAVGITFPINVKLDWLGTALLMIKTPTPSPLGSLKSRG